MRCSRFSQEPNHILKPQSKKRLRDDDLNEACKKAKILMDFTSCGEKNAQMISTFSLTIAPSPENWLGLGTFKKETNNEPSFEEVDVWSPLSNASSANEFVGDGEDFIPDFKNLKL